MRACACACVCVYVCVRVCVCVCVCVGVGVPRGAMDHSISAGKGGCGTHQGPCSGFPEQPALKRPPLPPACVLNTRCPHPQAGLPTHCATWATHLGHLCHPPGPPVPPTWATHLGHLGHPPGPPVPPVPPTWASERGTKGAWGRYSASGCLPPTPSMPSGFPCCCNCRLAACSHSSSCSICLAGRGGAQGEGQRASSELWYGHAGVEQEHSSELVWARRC